MEYIIAYTLAKTCLTADTPTIKSLFAAINAPCTDLEIENVISKLSVKPLNEIIEDGKKKMALSAPVTVSAEAGKKEEVKEEVKEEEEMDLDLFDDF